MHVHFVGVAGSGMGALAGLLKSQGHVVSGSDVTFDPPMGPALQAWGIQLRQGYCPDHLEPTPDVVVVGNVCRRDNPEAQAAFARGIRVTDMAHALSEFVLDGVSPLVVAGTHGKTTTTALSAWLLHDAGWGSGFLVGGLPANFGASFHLPRLSHGGEEAQGVANATAERLRRVPFVVEGDEYDTAFFEKTPKFWHYRPEVAILTSIEQDHIDIYPTFASYLDAFRGFIARVNPSGLIVASAADPHVVSLIRESAQCEVAWFALQGDDFHGQSPTWLAAPLRVDGAEVEFELFVGGVASGRVLSPLAGRHNIRNVLAALGAVTQGYGVPLAQARTSLRRFLGVGRRQELVGTPRGVRIYDDFAHHPTAVSETLRALRARHPHGALFAVFEPRSATACRSLHQQSYAEAFDEATHVLIAPLGRTNIPVVEQLDTALLIETLRARGRNARVFGSIEPMVQVVASEARSGDTVVLLSNGSFGGIRRRLLDVLDT